MILGKRTWVVGGGVILSLFVLYGGIFYYQHMRVDQKIAIPEEVAIPTQDAGGARNTEVATSTQDNSGTDGAEEATSTPIVPISAVPCRVSGCSDEICAEGNLVSTCIYKPEYACYKAATCERQNTGVCGWTETPELLSCVVEKQDRGNILPPQ